MTHFLPSSRVFVASHMMFFLSRSACLSASLAACMTCPFFDWSSRFPVIFFLISSSEMMVSLVLFFSIQDDLPDPLGPQSRVVV